MNFENDPVGYAIQDFGHDNANKSITVYSELTDDDEISIQYLFRSIDLMPNIEKTALSLCQGKILDVGAGAGCHSIILKKKGFDITSIDLSQGAVDKMIEAGLSASKKTIFNLSEEKFDTILLLMNGIGLAETIDQLDTFLLQLKKILSPNGKIYCDSTDLAYLYQEDDGSILLDLNARYYGEMKFKMKYKNAESNWFSWLFIDFENLTDHANSVGLKCTFVEEGDSNNYLVCLEHD